MSPYDALNIDWSQVNPTQMFGSNPAISDKLKRFTFDPATNPITNAPLGLFGQQAARQAGITGPFTPPTVAPPETAVGAGGMKNFMSKLGGMANNPQALLGLAMLGQGRNSNGIDPLMLMQLLGKGGVFK